MFYLAEKNENIGIAGTGIPPAAYKSNTYIPENIFSLIPDTFELNTPINLFFETSRPSQKGADFIVMQASPEQTFYYVDSTANIPGLYSHRQLHRHNFYELMYVIEGQIYQNIEYERHLYTTGSSCLMNRNVFHLEEFNEDNRILYLQFTSDFINEILNIRSCFPPSDATEMGQMTDFFQRGLASGADVEKSYVDFIPVDSEDLINSWVYNTFEAIFKHILTPCHGSNFYVRGMVVDLLCTLFDQKHFHQAPIRIGKDREQQLFDAVTRYLSRNHGRATRKELEAQFNYSATYIYRIVQKYTGLSLFDYRMKFCLREAASLLTESTMNITDIACKLGFSNITHPELFTVV